MNRRRFPALCALPAAALLLAAAGCAASSAPSPSAAVAAASGETALEAAPDVSVYCSVANLSSAVGAGMARGVQDACGRLAVQLILFDSQNDSAAQRHGLAQFAEAARGAESGVVLCQPVEEPPLREVFRQMESAGLTVLTFGAQAGVRDAGVLTPPYQCGQLLAQEAAGWIADEWGGRADVAVLEIPQTPGGEGGAGNEDGGDAPDSAGAGMADALAESAPRARVRRYAVTGSMAETIDAVLRELTPDIILAETDALALEALALWQPAPGGASSDALPAAPVPLFAGIGAGWDALQAIRQAGAYRASLDLCGAEAGEELVRAALAAPPGAAGRVRPRVVNAGNIGAYDAG